MNNKVVGIGLSGGVDSSVAAYLLKEQGYKVVGITMKLIDDEKTNNAIHDAKEVCDFLGISHHVVDLQKEFKEIVIDNFVNSYKEGKTPNPCVICNKHFKFGLFFETAKKLGCNYIATGHYAKIKDNKLYMSDVATKDQSYFLYGISKEILKHVIFPLQGYEDKVQIRKIAEEIGLKISDKKDSQEVCFIPNDDYKAYLNNYLDEAPKEGDICLEDGTVLGKHNGLINYTIGQRKGLNISYKTPLYVTRLDRDNNRLIVSDNEGLFNKSLIAKDINLLVDNWDFDKEIYAKVRSRGVPKRCNISLLPDNQANVNFLEEVRAITPGQSVVFYDKDGLCIGGGIIIES